MEGASGWPQHCCRCSRRVGGRARQPRHAESGLSERCGRGSRTPATSPHRPLLCSANTRPPTRPPTYCPPTRPPAPPPTHPTCKHRELANVVEGAQPLAAEAAPHVPHKNLGPLVEEELAAPGARSGGVEATEAGRGGWDAGRRSGGASHAGGEPHAAHSSTRAFSSPNTRRRACSPRPRASAAPRAN